MQDYDNKGYLKVKAMEDKLYSPSPVTVSFLFRIKAYNELENNNHSENK